MQCLLVSSKQDGGFYGVDMEIEELKGDSKNQRVKHVVAFEDRKDALKFGRLLEHDSGSGFQRVDICPFSPKVSTLICIIQKLINFIKVILFQSYFLFALDNNCFFFLSFYCIW